MTSMSKATEIGLNVNATKVLDTPITKTFNILDITNLAKNPKKAKKPKIAKASLDPTQNKLLQNKIK